MQTAFDGSEDAVACQCTRHRNVAAWIVLFKQVREAQFYKESIHHPDYDEGVFTCIQSSSMSKDISCGLL